MVQYLETNQNQNQESNIIVCEKHKNKCKTFKFDYEHHHDIFRCHSCMIEEKQDYSQTVPLTQVCQYNNSTVILSWPPLSDQQLLQKVLQISQQCQPRQTECDKIIDFFDQLTTQVLLKINEKKKIILKQAENKIDSCQQVYQQIASLQQLKEIIEDDKMSITQKSESISSIIQIKNSEKIKNTQLMKQSLQEQTIQKFFDLNIFNQYKTSLISYIELLDYHNQTLIQDFNSFTQQFFPIQNSFNFSNQTINNMDIENESNFDRIIKQISNKSNSRYEEYLDSVKIELNKLQLLINNLNIEKEVYQQNQKQINFDLKNQKDDEIENIQLLDKLMKIFNLQYNQIKDNFDESVLNQQLQLFSFSVMEKIFKIQQLITKQKNINIKKLLKKQPIFEVEQIFLPVEQYKFELSKFNFSQKNGKFGFDNNGFQCFEAINKESYTISYIRINQDCKYRIRIKMDLNNNDKCFLVGLVKDSDIDITYIHDISKINSFVPGSNYVDYGVSKVLKGQCLRNLKCSEQYNEIEVRICVKERLFEVCDYPKRENINTINDNRLNMIDPNSVYHLGFQLYYPRDKITIIEFEKEIKIN